MKRRPGFVTPAGMAAAVALVAAVAVWALAGGHAMFSPGALNAETRAAGAATDGGQTGAAGTGVVTLGGVASHAGIGRCSACHPAPWSSQTMAVRCLDCHTSVREEIEAGEGLHASLAGPPASPTCRDCHPEHNGPHGALTSLDAVTFPHDATGFSLRTHQRRADGSLSACGDCHTGGYGGFDAAVCVACHERIDAAFLRPHAAAWGDACLNCHDGTGRDGAGFDHAAAAFPLAGRHARIACRDCHAGARTRGDLTSTPHACFACHADDDEHGGAYGTQSGDCHDAAAWDDVTFDHAAFPLDHGSEGRTTACKTCHPVGVNAWGCYGCHEHTRANMADKHKEVSGFATKDCLACHPGGRKAED